MIRTIDLAAWGNYVEEGIALYRGIDHTSDAWPAFLPINADDPDVSLLDFLHEQEDQESDYILTGESEEKQMSWVAHPYVLPFAFDILPLLWSRQDPPWWVRIQYAEVTDQLRIETWEQSRPRRIIHIGPEMPWILYGEPYAWEEEFWSGRQPVAGEFEGAPPPLTLAPEAERVDLSALFILKGGARGVAGGGLPRDYDADLGEFQIREGRAFWHGLKKYPRATEYAQRLPGSFVDDDGTAWIDLERANLVPDPTQVTEEDEWPDVVGLLGAALQHLLGVDSESELDAPDWSGLILTPSGNRPEKVADPA